MNQTHTNIPKNERPIYREFKPNRIYPCGCEEKETVDPRSGMYMWEQIKKCSDHGGNNEWS